MSVGSAKHNIVTRILIDEAHDDLAETLRMLREARCDGDELEEVAVAERRLWIVEQSIACSPTLAVWELLKETDKTYVVRLRDGTRTFHKGTAGRSYFFEMEDVARFLRKIYAVELERADRNAKRMAYLVNGSYKLLTDFARGVDVAVDEVENASRRLE